MRQVIPDLLRRVSSQHHLHFNISSYKVGALKFGLWTNISQFLFDTPSLTFCGQIVAAADDRLPVPAAPVVPVLFPQLRPRSSVDGAVNWEKIGFKTFTCKNMSPPPPPSKELLAAFTIASISRRVMSPSYRETWMFHGHRFFFKSALLFLPNGYPHLSWSFPKVLLLFYLSLLRLPQNLFPALSKL